VPPDKPEEALGIASKLAAKPSASRPAKLDYMRCKEFLFSGFDMLSDRFMALCSTEDAEEG
jgi:hypothetical protein